MPAVMLDAARWAALVTVASLPFSTALMNLSAALAFALWALSGRWRASARAIAAEPAAWIGWVLFALLAAGIAWSLAPPAKAADILAKYRELLLFGAVMCLFAEPRWRARALWVAFATGVAMLLGSYAVQLDLLPAHGGRNMSAVLKKSPITHSLFMSVLAYGAAVMALRLRGWPRAGMVAVALLAAVNVLVSVQGRTGYVVLGVLLLWLAATRWSMKGVAVALLAAAAALAAAYQWAPAFRGSVDETVAEARQAQKGVNRESIAKRLYYWQVSARALWERPLLGAGTGAWEEAFYASGGGDDPYFRKRSHTHPHNEYANLAVQVGFPGLLLLAALFGFAFVRAGALPEPEAALARGFVIAFALGCAFNDFLLDATEGHLWAMLGGVLFGASPALDGRAFRAASSGLGSPSVAAR